MQPDVRVAVLLRLRGADNAVCAAQAFELKDTAMNFAAHRKMYRESHQTLGCKITHMVGIPIIVASLVMLFFNWPVGLGMFVFGWVLQFIGHFVFEKNRPVLFQDPKNPLTYFYAVIFVLEEWWQLLTTGSLKN